MHIQHMTKADEQRLQEALHLVVCHHPAIGDFMDGLTTAIDAAAELEALPSRDDNGFIEVAIGFAHALRTFRDVLECLRPEDLQCGRERASDRDRAGWQEVKGIEIVGDEVVQPAVNGMCEV